MVKNAFIIISIVFLGFSCKKEKNYQSAIEKSSEWIHQMMQEQHIPGLSVSVSIKEKLVWSEGFGYADLEQQVPVKAGVTKFRIGSVSKPLTAAALGLLMEGGKLDVDRPVQQYVPSFPEKEYSINTRQLAGHLAGIRHYRGEEFLNARHFETVEEGLDIFKDDSLLFEPGTRFSYSSYGWNLVSAVIEEVSGEDFLSYMRKNVFVPLKMKNTIADYTDSIIPYRTRFYEVVDTATLMNAPYVDNSYKWAGGGFLSTTDDLVKFGYAHIHPGFLDSLTLRQLITSQLTASGDSTHYGMGWRSGTNDFGRKWFGHSGGSVGGITMLAIYPEYEVVIAFLTNSGNVRYKNLYDKIAEEFIVNDGNSE